MSRVPLAARSRAALGDDGGDEAVPHVPSAAVPALANAVAFGREARRAPRRCVTQRRFFRAQLASIGMQRTGNPPHAQLSVGERSSDPRPAPKRTLGAGREE